MTQKLNFASCVRKISQKKMVVLGFFCLGPVTAGGLQKVSHSWWSQNRAVKSNFWSHYRTFLPNVGLGLNPTTHSTQCDPAG